MKTTKSRRRSAREKLSIEREEYGKPFVIPVGMRGGDGQRTMIVPRPLDVEALMRGVRKGRLMTTGQVRAALARRAGADECCPLTTGIFARLAAEAAVEDQAAGKKRVTPQVTDGAR